MKRWNAVLVCFLWLSIIVLSGCAGTNKKTVIKPVENNMKKIAVIGESKIYYPRRGGQSPVLDLEASKKAMDIHFYDIEAILKQRGYEIQYCKPAGVGYLYINDENLVVKDYGTDNSTWKIKGGGPVFEYMDVKENKEFGRAVRRAFEHITAETNAKQYDSYLPLAYDFDLAALRDFTKADTVCFSSITGNRYTEGRKAGAALSQIGSIVLGPQIPIARFTGIEMFARDMVGSNLACIDTSTGTLLWSAWQAIFDDPLNEKVDIMKKLLASFPERGKPLNP